MIWFRRITAILLILAFIVIFVLVLLITQVSGTVTNPGFYNEQLEQADVYNFIYDELLPAALDEIEEDDPGDNPVDLSAIEDDLVAAARKILPPEWLEEQVESATGTLIPYLLNDTDDFTYTVLLKDRVETAADVIKSDILRGGVSTNVYSDLVSYAAEKVHGELDKLPYALALTEEQIEDAIETAIPEYWVTSQLEAAIDSAVPYFTKDSGSFTITVRFDDRIDPVAEALIDLLGSEDTYDDLITLLTPVLESELGAAVDLYKVHNSSKKVTLSTRDDIVPAIQGAISHEWGHSRFAAVIRGIAAYVKGESSEIAVPIDLSRQKDDAVAALAELADGKLRELFQSLPVCSNAEFSAAVMALPHDTQPPYTLPGCRAAGMSYGEFQLVLGIDIEEAAEQQITDVMPDLWFYDYDDLKLSLGDVDDGFIEDIRGWAAGGWTYTDADLREDLDADGEEDLEDTRGWIAAGYTVTGQDFRDLISEDTEDLESFDEARRWTGTAVTWMWALWLIPVLLLVAIGFLGGRNWGSRIAWALAVLLFASLAVYIAAGTTYSGVGEPELRQALPDPAEYEGAGAVLIEKGNELIENAADSFISGIQGTTLGIVIGSAAALLYIAACSIYNRRHPEREEPDDSARLVLVRFFGVDGDDSD